MKTVILFVGVICAAAGLLAQSRPAQGQPGMIRQSFGKTSDGHPAQVYALRNRNGVEVRLTDFGATVVSVKVPDAAGHLDDVVLGYDDVRGYENGKAYFGATVGRYANRIAHATFQLNGTTYHVRKNNGDNSLHGHFNKVFWTAKNLSHGHSPSVEFSYLSPDGDEGYPGNLSVRVRYTLTDLNELRIEYAATTDKPTVLNLTHHSYWNLAGQGKGDILKHEVMLNADRFTPVNADVIPTGEIRSVKGTPFDFTRMTVIGARIDQDDPQLKLGHGYDHNWVLNKQGKALLLAAEAYDPTTGRVLQVSTTEPGIQFYTGNFLDGSEKGKGGQAYGRRSAFSLESQHFPDSPNEPKFPSTVLNPGERFESTTVFKLSVRPPKK